MSENLEVCIISKFPSIEGGMASKAYWLASGLADKNIDVTVLTNSNVVEKEYSVNANIKKPIKNLLVEQISLPDQFYIPHRQLDIICFLDKFAQIAKHKKIKLIDAHYLIPYGIIAYIVSKLFNIPYVIRHGGSDINKFLNKQIFEELLSKVLSEASIVETNDKLVEEKSKRTIRLPPYVPNENFFNTENREKSHGEKIRIAYIGKINNLWRYKGLDKIANVFGKMRDKIELVFLAQGLGMNDFKSNVETGHIKFYDFMPPWEMPSFYKKIDYIILLLNDNPLPDWPNVVPEALLSGVKIITDNKNFFKKFQGVCEDVDKSVLQLNMKADSVQIYNDILNFKSNAKVELLMSYDAYVEKNIQVYKDAIKNHIFV